jgi:hypothetical protein
MRLEPLADYSGCMTCPTCGQPVRHYLTADIDRAVRVVTAVDRAVRVRELAAKRAESPFKFPADVAARLGRAA